MGQNCVGIFKSIHFVLKAEKALKQKGIAVVTMPVPRKISSDCGIAISFLAQDLRQVRDILKMQKYQLEAIYTPGEDGTYEIVD